MPKLEPLHERTFAGKPLKSFKVYNDPFGANEVCIELTFVDGQVECVGIGPGRPEVVSSALCYEGGRAQEHLEVAVHGFTNTEDGPQE
jgi:hypothetical protein